MRASPNPLARPEAIARSARIIEAARAEGASPRDPAPVKRARARELRDAGARTMDIAALYGTTDQCVCTWLSGRVSRQLTALEWGLIQGLREQDQGKRDGPVATAMLHLLREAEITVNGGHLSIRWAHLRPGS